MNFIVYILQSKKDKGYYVGLSKDVNNRLAQHNKGRVRSTKHRVPFSIVHTEAFNSRPEARAREKHLKSYRGSKEKLTILEGTK